MKNKFNIEAIAMGNTVNVSINGKLHKASFTKHSEALEMYKFILGVKENPTQEGVNSIYNFLNINLRIAMDNGLETDPNTGSVYLAGFMTPVPETLIKIIEEYHTAKLPLTPLINFWKLLMLNPDERVRTSLFDFINTHDFVLTDKGYMIVYKAVANTTKTNSVVNDKLKKFVDEQYKKIKNVWKRSPKNYIVLKANRSKEYTLANLNTYNNSSFPKHDFVEIGKLADLHNNITKTQEDVVEPIYTDKHTKTFEIKLGEPVRQERKICDANPANDCSVGLHVGATKYVERFANSHGDTILACYVNPAHVVAVPNYDHSKMRVSEYFPFAIVGFEKGKIDAYEQKFFESDYSNYEKNELDKMVAEIKNKEIPIKTKETLEERPLSELTKIIEARLIDLV